jgi:hypothetical protein
LKNALQSAFFYACSTRFQRPRVTTLHFKPVNDQVVAVYLPTGELVGNLKHIGSVWKFKAIGVEAGQLVPGGGPLTHRHNLTFAALDQAAISAALRGD